MLRSYQRQGQIRLQEERERRTHAWWLDRWIAESDSTYCVFIDSDVVVHSARWLPRLLARAERTGAAIVAGEFCSEVRNFVEPVGLRRVRLAGRPAPWLMLVRPEPLRRLECSFAWAKQEPAAVPEGIVAYDVGALLFKRARESGLRFAVMPWWYPRWTYTHVAGGSWRRGRAATPPES